MQFHLAFFLAAVSLSSSALAGAPESQIFNPPPTKIGTIPEAELKHPTSAFVSRDSVPALGLGDHSSNDPKALAEEAAKQVGAIALNQVKGTIQGYLSEVGTGVRTAKQLEAFLPAGALPIRRDSTPAIGLGDQSSNDPAALVKDGAKQVEGLALAQVKGQVQGYLGEVGTGVRTAKQAEAFLPAGALPIKRALGDIKPVEALLGQNLIRRALDSSDLKSSVLSAPADAKTQASQVLAKGQSTVANLQQQVQDAPVKAQAFVKNTENGLEQGAELTQERLQFASELTQNQLGGLAPGFKRALGPVKSLEELSGQSVIPRVLNPDDLKGEALSAPADATQVLSKGQATVAGVQQQIQEAPAKAQAFVQNSQNGLEQGAKLTQERLEFGSDLTREQLGGFAPGSRRDTILPAFSLFPGAGPQAVELKNKLQGLTGKGKAQGVNAPSGAGAATGSADVVAGLLGGAKRMEKVKRST